MRQQQVNLGHTQFKKRNKIKNCTPRLIPTKIKKAVKFALLIIER
ncbi:hypothetical protein GLIP_3563 [Aliiglaciecola lipolytica E3]|uniref:Uncharacterized protein n=1 Tax=Aliiglaciecola lipolytica E3 TaxID=1127673 RepID=K6YY67_9ALTE|nr:hypothetical protein GLIP_3563 [Aliiglaciecola lipolytica E3]